MDKAVERTNVCICENCMRRDDNQLNYIFDDTDLKEYQCPVIQRRVTEKDYCSFAIKRSISEEG